MNGPVKSSETAENSRQAPARERAAAFAAEPAAEPGLMWPVGDLRYAGNLAVQRLLRSGALRAKRAVSQPGDADEQEADRVAEHVMAAPAATLQRQCACGGKASAGGECEECRAGAQAVQRKAASQETHAEATASSSSDFRGVLGVGGGSPLDSSSRAFMEARFGRDFGGVRVHTGAHAAESARAVNARAYTAGRDIVFAAGEYAPESAEGRKLLAHELTHVVQQERASLSLIRRQPAGGASQSPADSTTPAPAAGAAPDGQTPAAPSSGLIVEDSEQNVGPNQMKRGQFMSQLRGAVDGTVNQALAGSPWASVMRPKVNEEVERQFGLYSGMDGRTLENKIRQGVPGAAGATTAAAFIPPICEQVRQNVVANLPQDEGVMGMAGEAAGVFGSAVQTVGDVISGIGDIFFKPREGGARKADDPRAVRSQLRGGQSLDGHTRTQMATAFGQDFSDVRVHTGAGAAQLADRMNARAFTYGRDIAFGTGEYRPGTLIGDALLAHELAHVAQQRGASPATSPMARDATREDAFEEDADTAAVGAMVSLWGRTIGVLPQMARTAMPALRSGLKLRRCSGKKDEPAPETTTAPPTATPAPSTTPTTPIVDSRPLSEQFRNGAERQGAINKAIGDMGGKIDLSLIEGGQMRYAGDLGEGFTFTPRDKPDPKEKLKPPCKAPFSKPCVGIYGGAFGGGWPTLISTIWHEYQHVLQMAPGSKMDVPGVKGNRDAQETEAYANEILTAEEHNVHLEKKITVARKDGSFEDQTGAQYIKKTLWSRLKKHWDAVTDKNQRPALARKVAQAQEVVNRVGQD